MVLMCKRFLVSGLVQGVGFRYHTQRAAVRFGLRGWVQNLQTGDVEVVACGEPDQLQALHEWLSNGPPLARVDAVEQLPVGDAPDGSGFAIR